MNEQNETAGLPCPEIEGTSPNDKELFSYQGYQVVRREFLAHAQEPAITFSRYQISVNAACLRKLPQVDYVQALVNSDTKKLVLRPCGEDEKDSFSWRANSKSGRRPKRITCRIFYAKIMELMGWGPELRYKLLGKLIHSNVEQLLLFDLTRPQIFQYLAAEQGVCQSGRAPVFPAEWKHQFGLPEEEHRRCLQIDLFHGYALFDVRVPKPPLPHVPPEEEADTLERWITTNRRDGAKGAL
ncbi:MAG: integrase [Oscillospiraceae bacterium]|nr:integrase [Oscillospiraceae bacterium]